MTQIPRLSFTTIVEKHRQYIANSVDFNFISLPKPAVDKNWVCRHRLLILGK